MLSDPFGASNSPLLASVAHPPPRRVAIAGGVDSQNEGEKNVENSNYVTSPPSETPRDLADFRSGQGHAPRFARKGRALSVSISLRPGASGVLKLSELEEDATYQEPFSNLMVDASGRRWLTHTDESEWIKVFDAEELDHRKLAFSGCRL